MLRFALRKIGEALVILVIVTLGVTLLTTLIPGSPAALILGDSTNQAAVDKLNEQYGFEDPFFQRYWAWLGDAVHGDLGNSIQSNESIGGLLVSRLPVTLELAVLALLVSLLISVPLAMICGAREGGRTDRFVSVISSAAFSLPAFVGCVFLSELLASEVKLLPVYGWVPLSQDVGENLLHATLPVLVLAVSTTPLFLRVLRSDVVSVLREDFVMSARAKGLPDRYILLRHVLRPASLSLLTLVGLVFGFLLGGSIIVENYFSLPGIGQAVGQAVAGKDLPVVQGVVVVVALVYLVLNTVVDIAYKVLDPRTSGASR